jgi:hypothetical protein
MNETAVFPAGNPVPFQLLSLSRAVMMSGMNRLIFFNPPSRCNVWNLLSGTRRHMPTGRLLVIITQIADYSGVINSGKGTETMIGEQKSSPSYLFTQCHTDLPIHFKHGTVQL